VKVELVHEVTDEVLDALGRLIPQLNPERHSPSRTEVEALIGSPDAVLLVLRDDDGMIRATTTVSFLVRLRGRRAWIEDVVVDEAARGHGHGRAIIEFAVDLAARRGVDSVRLTSGEHRAAAHVMYERIGFTREITRVYGMRLEES
jgi:GNAT superfamily N-acetyltransferase